MSAHLTQFKPLDPGRVDTMDPIELQYWSKKFQCSEAELAKALAKVGDHTTSVREYLASRH